MHELKSFDVFHNCNKRRLIKQYLKMREFVCQNFQFPNENLSPIFGQFLIVVFHFPFFCFSLLLQIIRTIVCCQQNHIVQNWLILFSKKLLISILLNKCIHIAHMRMILNARIIFDAAESANGEKKSERERKRDFLSHSFNTDTS